MQWATHLASMSTLTPHLVKLPNVLRRLSVIERILITRTFHVALQCIVGAKRPSLPDGLAFIAVPLPSSVGTTVTSDCLPIDDDTLQKVFLLLPQYYHDNAEGLNKVLIIRRLYVFEAIVWIRAHNPFYKTTRIDYATLNMLPNDGRYSFTGSVFNWSLPGEWRFTV
ncbi:hypothetical protein Hypma_009997 [Hypsizygus marmoreus]|uniref:DUF6570 domain-containing protein n=1 Tax=Hypsizygus marmoreus TaxID=39966 RepID=A0A369JR79_HYPMA|nr:hypothetical protein Hypma_009997 [Hypsizygus marmoreus]